ncbi:MAG: 4Fe-4S binding protein [Hadesarchaea archaeon]|nr:4Fe-4S binding protein [Hadesarchaea archaeon]
MSEIGVYRLNVGSCNGCDIEIVCALAERFGIGNLKARIVDEPEKANMLLVVGVVSAKMAGPIKEVYNKLREPKAVIAVGTCALSSGIFQKSYSALEPTDKFIPVNLHVPGCPPSPQAIGEGVARTMDVKYRRWLAPKGFRGQPELDSEKCTGCGACEKACPTSAIELADEGNKRTVKFMYDKCISCASCEEVCPEDAVRLAKKRHPSGPDRASMGVSAVEELAGCPICGTFEVPAKQIRALADRIIEAAKPYESFRKDIERAAAACSRCRGKTANLEGAKALLLKLEKSIIRAAPGSF